MSLAKTELARAVDELKKTVTKRKFNQSVELIVKLRDVDLNKPESRINELVELPHPPNKPVKVCVIAGGELALKAKKGGADLVLDRGDLDKLGKDKKAARSLANEYDFFIAEAPLMPQVGKTIGAILGPRGKMPSPVPPTAPIGDIIARHKRTVRVRVRNQPVVQCRIATEDMEGQKISENLQAVLTGIERKLERGTKNIGAILIKPTMGKPVKLTLGKT